jgi:hypothetical protein
MSLKLEKLEAHPDEKQKQTRSANSFFRGCTSGKAFTVPYPWLYTDVDPLQYLTCHDDCRGPGSVIYLVPFRQMFHDDFKCVGMTLSSIPLQLLNIDLT